MAYFIGVDIGCTVVKSGIYSVEGEEIAVSSCYSLPVTVAAGFSERDMELLWQDVCKTLTAVLQQSGVLATEIKGIGFSSHGKGLYAINKKGKPVRNGILSSDNRTEQQIAELITPVTAKRIYSRSLQPVWSCHPAMLLHWLKYNEPRYYDAIDKILMVHDYIRYRLTGEVAAEITNISGSNLFNQYTGDYDRQLMAEFAITEVAEKTAPVIGCAQLAGSVTSIAAKQCGLLKGTAVYAGVFDVVGAALCSSVADRRILSTVAGTWAIATSVTQQLLQHDYPFAWGHYCLDGHYFVHEGSPTSAGNLSWFLRQFCGDDIQYYQHCDQWVTSRYLSAATENNDSILFLPYLYGANCFKNLSGALVGLRGHNSMADIVYAIYQGIVFSHCIHQDRILRLNPYTERIRMTGGPTQSAIWMQMFADASNLPLEVVKIQQGGCRAAALCAAVGSGEYNDFSQAMQATTPELTVYLPDISAHQRLREKFSHYIELARTLSNIKYTGLNYDFY